MAKNDVKVTDNPKLKQKKLSDGNYSLYLEYYLGYTKVYDDVTGEEKIKLIRKKEFLGLTVYGKPRTPVERESNRKNNELAQEIRKEREQEFLKDTRGYRLKKSRNTDFVSLFQSYIDNYTKRDVRMLNMTLRWFKDFINDTSQYEKFKNGIKPDQLSKEMIVAFTEYLKDRGTGETPKSVLQRFKKVVKWAIENGYMATDPTKGVRITTDEQILRKDVLSTEEIVRLINTHYYGENPEIRRAFIFCCYCGLRFCDVKELTYRNIDYSNRLLKFEQNKTKGHSATSGVIIPLNDGILSLLGEPAEGGEDSLVFRLPTHTMCLKALRRWTAHAGITKHITWHCGRHSFAVNILNNGANIKTVASLLGHSGLKHTEKYTRAVDELKQKAIDSLPTLDLTNL